MNNRSILLAPFLLIQEDLDNLVQQPLVLLNQLVSIVQRIQDATGVHYGNHLQDVIRNLSLLRTLLIIVFGRNLVAGSSPEFEKLKLEPDPGFLEQGPQELEVDVGVRTAPLD